MKVTFRNIQQSQILFAVIAGYQAVAQHAFGNGFTFVRDYRAGKSR